MIRNERRAIQLRRDPVAMAMFLDLLCGKDGESGRSDGARWLSLMNETGDPRPLAAGLGAHRRADAVRHLPCLSRSTSIRSRRCAFSSRVGARRADRHGAGRLQHRRSSAIAPRALHRRSAARHRQGPRRRPFGARRRNRAHPRPAARSFGRGDRDGVLACAASSAAQPDRVQARYRRSKNHSRPRRYDPVAGAAASCCWC